VPGPPFFFFLHRGFPAPGRVDHIRPQPLIFRFFPPFFFSPPPPGPAARTFGRKKNKALFSPSQGYTIGPITRFFSPLPTSMGEQFCTSTNLFFFRPLNAPEADGAWPPSFSVFSPPPPRSGEDGGRCTSSPPPRLPNRPQHAGHGVFLFSPPSPSPSAINCGGDFFFSRVPVPRHAELSFFLSHRGRESGPPLASFPLLLDVRVPGPRRLFFLFVKAMVAGPSHLSLHLLLQGGIPSQAVPGQRDHVVVDAFPFPFPSLPLKVANSFSLFSPIRSPPASTTALFSPPSLTERSPPCILFSPLRSSSGPARKPCRHFLLSLLSPPSLRAEPQPAPGLLFDI